MPGSVILVVEDQLGLAIAERLVAHVAPDAEVHLRQVMSGRERIKASLPKYMNACRVIPHLVLVDLDSDECPLALLDSWGALPSREGLLLRVVQRETEAWLLSDRAGFSSYAGVPLNKVPQAPETLTDAKQTLINIVRRSRSRRLAQELVPAVGSRLSIGPLYNERLGAFVRDNWSIADAAACAPGLARTIQRLSALLG